MPESRKNPKRGKTKPTSKASKKRQQNKNYKKRDERLALETQKALESLVKGSE